MINFKNPAVRVGAAALAATGAVLAATGLAGCGSGSKGSPAIPPGPTPSPVVTQTVNITQGQTVVTTASNSTVDHSYIVGVSRLPFTMTAAEFTSTGTPTTTPTDNAGKVAVGNATILTAAQEAVAFGGNQAGQALVAKAGDGTLQVTWLVVVNDSGITHTFVEESVGKRIGVEVVQITVGVLHADPTVNNPDLSKYLPSAVPKIGGFSLGANGAVLTTTGNAIQNDYTTAYGHAQDTTKISASDLQALATAYYATPSVTFNLNGTATQTLTGQPLYTIAAAAFANVVYNDAIAVNYNPPTEPTFDNAQETLSPILANGIKQRLTVPAAASPSPSGTPTPSPSPSGTPTPSPTPAGTPTPNPPGGGTTDPTPPASPTPFVYQHAANTVDGVAETTTTGPSNLNIPNAYAAADAKFPSDTSTSAGVPAGERVSVVENYDNAFYDSGTAGPAADGKFYFRADVLIQKGTDTAARFQASVTLHRNGSGIGQNVLDQDEAANATRTGAYTFSPPIPTKFADVQNNINNKYAVSEDTRNHPGHAYIYQQIINQAGPDFRAENEILSRAAYTLVKFLGTGTGWSNVAVADLNSTTLDSRTFQPTLYKLDETNQQLVQVNNDGSVLSGGQTLALAPLQEVLDAIASTSTTKAEKVNGKTRAVTTFQQKGTTKHFTAKPIHGRKAMLISIPNNIVETPVWRKSIPHLARGIQLTPMAA